MHTALRILIIVEALAAISFFILNTIFEKKLAIELQEYLDSSNKQEISPIVLFRGYFGLVLLVLFFISWIGLFSLWNPARFIYVFGWIASIFAIEPFGGPKIAHEIPSLFDEIHTIIGGVIIGVIFFSPVKDMF